jgi:hypothetical protein
VNRKNGAGIAGGFFRVTHRPCDVPVRPNMYLRPLSENVDGACVRRFAFHRQLNGDAACCGKQMLEAFGDVDIHPCASGYRCGSENDEVFPRCV